MEPKQRLMIMGGAGLGIVAVIGILLYFFVYREPTVDSKTAAAAKATAQAMQEQEAANPAPPPAPPPPGVRSKSGVPRQ